MPKIGFILPSVRFSCLAHIRTREEDKTQGEAKIEPLLHIAHKRRGEEADNKLLLRNQFMLTCFVIMHKDFRGGEGRRRTTPLL